MKKRWWIVWLFITLCSLMLIKQASTTKTLDIYNSVDSNFHLSPVLYNHIGQPVSQPSNLQQFNTSRNLTQNFESSLMMRHIIGNINNEYGIRSDILAYILEQIPPNNINAINAAIRYVQYGQQIYFNPDPVQAREYAVWLGNPMYCLDAFLGEEKSTQILEGLSNLFNNTFERKVWTHHIEYTVLSGHIYDLTAGELRQMTVPEKYKFCQDDGKYWRE